MQRYSRGGMYTSGGGGGGGKANYPTNGSNSQSFQVGPTSPLRVNPGQPARVINHESSYSVAKPTSPVARSDRSFPRSSIKQVRYDNRGSASTEGSWHSRSSSEHSYLSQNFRPQVGFDESPTVFAFSPSTMSPYQQEEAGTDALTPTGHQQPSNTYFNESPMRRTSRPNMLNKTPGVSRTADNMYSQLSAMAKLPSKKTTQNNATFSRRGSHLSTSDGGTIQRMQVNGVEQPPLNSDAETIKRRLLEDYQHNRLKAAMNNGNSSTSGNRHYPIPPYYDELTHFHAGRAADSGALKRSQEQSRYGTKRRQSGTVIIPSRSADNCMTRSEYNDRTMDYRGNSTAAINNSTGNGSALNDYLCGSISVITSPTVGRGSTRYIGQSSPSSVIEELQNRFQSTSRSREKRPILKNVPVNQDYSSPVYHRRTATAVSTSTTSLSSKPHHQSELMLPTTSSAEMIYEPPTRAINTASTVRMDPNGTMRAGGPSFRRLQTLYGTSNINQKRYPSDNALDMTYMEEKSQQPSSLMPQFYVSGRKAGTVKIAVRSRSEQTSPTNGPASPRQVFRVAAGGGGGTAYDDSVRSQQVILPQSALPKNNASSSVDGPQSEDDENQALPSVREIIRQVEEMTLKNNNSAHNSNTSLDHSHSGGSIMHISRSLSRPVNAEVPSGGANSRSLSASSAQINGETMGRTQNHNGTYYATSSNSSDYDSHTVGRGYATTRRGDFDSDNRRSAGQSAVHVARKGDMIANLPQDYQKLLEAFLEQRKEIQRLRKEMADKDRLIASLQKDIHLYEPWR